MILNRRDILLAGAALGLAGCGGSRVSLNPAQAQAATPQTAARLFVLNSEAGQLVGGRLTLTGVHPDTIWFNDRPVRGAGRQDTGRFIAEWEQVNGFTSVPPNALLQTGSGQDSQALVLQSPLWDEPARTLTFEVTIDPGVSATFPSTFGPAALFIDDAGGSAGAVPISAPVLFEIEGYGQVGVDLITQDAPVRFGMNANGMELSLDADATGFNSILFDDAGQEVLIQLDSGSCILSIDLQTTSNIVNFGIVQVFGPVGSVVFQGHVLQRTPLVLPWKGTVA